MGKLKKLKQIDIIPDKPKPIKFPIIFKEYLDDYEISVEEFQETHKQIILL